MVRLIVEEDGRRRAFRLGHGVLTVGSGPEARLKLTAADVAELHAEIELRGDAALLRPRPGVLPPTVGGAPAPGETTLALGQVVQIGGARLWIEDEAAPAATPAAPAAPAAATAPTPPASPAVPGAERERRRRQAIEGARATPRRSVVERTRPRHKKGLPTGAVVAIWLGVVAVVLVAGIRIFTHGEASVLNVDAVLRSARQYMENGQPAIAEQEIVSVESNRLSEAQRDEIASIRKAIVDAEKAVQFHKENAVGTRYRDNQLEKYESVYLQGNPEKHKIRLFLKRCEEFRRRWPNHPEMAWVDRHEARFKGIVSLADPPTLEDVLWEVRDFVDTSPRHYDDAFAMLDEFAATASAADRAVVDERRLELIAERKEYALDRLQQAKYELNKKNNPGKAVWWLVNSVCFLGDPEMENDAARRLLQMPDIAEHLLGYKNERPEYWKELMENRIVRDGAKRLKIY